MISQLGWTHISRAAVQRAEAQLANESQGVIDELGMLEIHQAYADRFFPGTSVLHTRLRYVLFVAWTYESLRHGRGSRTNIDDAIAETERRLGMTLKRNTQDWGLIGRRALPRMPAQRPSMMYWSALGVWGLLHRNNDGTLPSRAEIHARLANLSGHSELSDDEGKALANELSPFVTLPRIPVGWPQGEKLDFTLTTQEQTFLRNHLGSVYRPGTTERSLLARLAAKRAGTRLTQDSPLLCKEVRDVMLGREEWAVLQRAVKAGALAAIVRGIYLALVELLCIQDGMGEREVSLANLNEALETHRDEALALDLSALVQDVGFRPKSGVPALLLKISEWLADHRTVSEHEALRPLLEDCLAQERTLKGGSRARLAPFAVSKRREWWLDKSRNNESAPESLHFRWHVVRNLLRDLENSR